MGATIGRIRSMGTTPSPLTKIPGFDLQPMQLRSKRAYARAKLGFMTNREFFASRGGDPDHRPHENMGSGLPLHEWRPLWQHEYDRRFLLRPAAYVPTDEKTLLRPL